MMPIDPIAQKRLELLMLLHDRIAQSGERFRPRTHIVDRAGGGLFDPLARAADQIERDMVDHAPDSLVDELALRERGVLFANGGVLPREQTHLAEACHIDQAGPESIVDVVIVVGDLIGQIRDLRFEARLLTTDEALAHIPELARIAERAVLEDALAALEGEVEPVEIRVAVLELIDHPQRLQVVLEASVGTHARVERILACMTEGCVPEIVREADRLGERLAEPEGVRDRAGDLRDLDGVRDARAVEVAFVVDEHLRLVDQAPERIGMNDAVAVALVLPTQIRFRLRVAPAARVPLTRSIGRESLVGCRGIVHRLASLPRPPPHSREPHPQWASSVVRKSASG